jgi:hypothetical protein
MNFPFGDADDDLSFFSAQEMGTHKQYAGQQTRNVRPAFRIL